MRAVEVRLSPEKGTFPGIDRTLESIPDVTRDELINIEWLTDGSYSLLYRLSGGDIETVEAVLTDHEEVHSHEVIPSDDSRFYVFAHVAERERLSEVLAIAEKYALLFNRPLSITDNGVVVTVIGTSESLQAAFADVTEWIPLSVEWVGEYTPGQHNAIEWLTPRQRKTLEVAHELGFYEMPRQASYREIADELDCAPSTANELLRRGEAALVEGILNG